MPNPTEQDALRVLVVDDNKLVCGALKIMLELADGLEYAGSLPSADDLHDKVLQDEPDIVVLDLDMPGRDPIDVVRSLAGDRPATRIIIYTGHVRQRLVDRVFAAGAWGFVGKCETPDALIDAIRRVAAGEVVIAPGSR
jgi:two-component system response regulator DesR